MMEAEERSVRMGSVVAHPLAELLECPADAGNLLNGSAQTLEVTAGDAVFRQDEICKGLYVVVSGLFMRKAERLKTRLTLGPARTGDLVELAAALGDGRHTYTLSAQSSGSLLLLPIESLNKVFEKLSPTANEIAGRTGARGFARLHVLLPEPNCPYQAAGRQCRTCLDRSDLGQATLCRTPRRTSLPPGGNSRKSAPAFPV